MNNFKKGGFNKGGFGDRKPFGGKSSFGGKPSFGGNSSFGGRSDFKKKSWDKGGDFGGDRQMHDATCSGCGKACQVPFRPSAGKEVFCNDCFGKVKGDETFVRNDSRSDFGDRAPRSGGQNIDAVVRQLQVVASKLDQLIGLMNAQAKPAAASISEKKSVAETKPASEKKPVAELADTVKSVTKGGAKKGAAPKKAAVAKVAPAKAAAKKTASKKK